MKQRQKMVSAGLAVLLSAAIMAACGTAGQQAAKPEGASAQADGKKDESPAKPAAKKTIVVYQQDVIKDQDIIDSGFYKDFEAQNNVQVKVIVQPSDKYVQSFMVAANGGQQIDALVMNGQDVRSFALKGLIQDITKDVTYLQDRFTDSAAKEFVVNGKLYAVPAGLANTTGLYYNKEIFAKYGLQPPKTYADMTNVIKVLNKNGIAGIGFGGATIYNWPQWYFAAFNQTSGNNGMQRTIDTLSGKAKFTDPDYVEAMGWFAQYAKDNMWQQGFNGADDPAGQATFISGKAGMFFGGSWVIGAFAKAGLDDKKIGIVPWPVLKEGVQAQQGGAPAGSGAAVYAKTENRDLALKLVDYFTSEQQQRKILDIRDSYLPANKKAVRDGADTLNQSILKNLIPVTVPYFDWYWPPEVATAFQQEIQAVAGQKEDPKAAMDKIQKVFDDLVAKGYNFNAAN